MRERQAVCYRETFCQLSVRILIVCLAYRYADRKLHREQVSKEISHAHSLHQHCLPIAVQ
jgi:hypothetical protein